MTTQKDKIEALHVKTVTAFRLASKGFLEFVNKAEKHHKTLVSTIETGTNMIGALEKLTIGLDDDDVGKAMKALIKCEKLLEVRRQESIIKFSESFLAAMKSHVQSDIDEFEAFEKQCQINAKHSQAQATKMEKAAVVAGKRDPKELQGVLADMRAHVTATEQRNAQQLRKLMLFKRKRYGRFISEWWQVMTSLNALADAILKSVDKHGEKWVAAAQDVESLPDAALQATGVSVARERTLIALSSGDDDAGQTGLCRARALYDCDADEPGDLSFVMGEVITVLAKDEQSGWWTGTAHGETGIFPSTYVIQLM